MNDVSTIDQVPNYRRLMLALWRANNPAKPLSREEAVTLISDAGWEQEVKDRLGGEK